MLSANGKSTPAWAAAAGTMVARCGGNSLSVAPLVEAGVGAAPHRHLAVAPGLTGQPLDHVVAVAPLVGERLEAAAGVAAAAHVHQDEDVTVAREVHRAVEIAVGDVRSQGEDDRQRLPRAAGR